jgi:hypothetical protein
LIPSPTADLLSARLRIRVFDAPYATISSLFSIHLQGATSHNSHRFTPRTIIIGSDSSP